jgi:hypothetical protein
MSSLADAYHDEHGVPIVTEKKTTNFKVTIVQRTFSQTMVIENLQDFRVEPYGSAGS